jgi:DNA-binding response OmpR family regulator
MVGDLWLDTNSRSAAIGNNRLLLTAAEFDRQLVPARCPRRVNTCEQPAPEVAGRDLEAFDRAIDVHNPSLRRKAGHDLRTSRLIEYVRSAGYRMRKPKSPSGE